MLDTSDAEVDRDATRTAVESAMRETGFSEPRPAIERSLAAHDDPDDDSPPDIAKIDADPQHRSVFRSITRKFHEATGRLAAQKRDMDMARDAVTSIRRDPQGTIRQMAEAAGMRVADEPTIADQVKAELAATIGQEAADVLAPAIVSVTQAITGKMISPFTARQEQEQQQAASARLKSEITSFASRVASDGGEWSDEVEQEMAAMVPKFPPGPGVTLPEYLEILHRNVVAKRGRGRRAPAAGAIRPGMNARDAARIAVASARRDLNR